MGGVWSIVAELEKVGQQRIILYDMDYADKDTGWNYGDICLACKEACENLLKTTQNSADKAFIKKEIAHLEAKSKEWRAAYKTW